MVRLTVACIQVQKSPLKSEELDSFHKTGMHHTEGAVTFTLLHQRVFSAAAESVRNFFQFFQLQQPKYLHLIKTTGAIIAPL